MTEPSAPSRLPIRTNEIALFVAILLVIAGATVIDTNHNYWINPASSARDIARHVAPLGIFALGATVVIIAGGIDLSAGSMIALSGTVCAVLLFTLDPGHLEGEEPPLMAITWAIIAALLSGLVVGTLHAWLITSIRLPPFIATLATLVGLRSFSRALSEFMTEKSELNLPETFFKWTRESVWWQLGLLIVIAAITYFLLNWTVLGRHLYALGGNEQAARLSGIRTENVKWFAYCFGSFTAALAGILYICNDGSAKPSNLGQGYELNGIAAAVVGGCSLQGGVGTVVGTLLGTVFLRVVMDAVAKVIKRGADVYEGMIVGLVVVVAVVLSQLQLWADRQRLLAGALGVAAIPILSLLSGLVTWMTMGKYYGISLGAVVLVGLIAIKIYEWRDDRA